LCSVRRNERGSQQDQRRFLGRWVAVLIRLVAVASDAHRLKQPNRVAIHDGAEVIADTLPGAHARAGCNQADRPPFRRLWRPGQPADHVLGDFWEQAVVVG
jgi:hypothetical protein